jgi:hypothetical protein
VREKDPDGRIVYHHRTVDTLGKMIKAGTIAQEMHDAAKDFQAAFIVANFDPLRALPILRTLTGSIPGYSADTTTTLIFKYIQQYLQVDTASALSAVKSRRVTRAPFL